MAPRPAEFAPGGNRDAAAWALRSAITYKSRGFTPGITRAWQVAASYAEFDKDEFDAWIGLGTWDNVYASIDTVAREARVSPRTVDRMFALVRRLGLVRVDGWAPHVEGTYAAVRYRLSGTPDCPLPVEVLMARAEREGQLFDVDLSTALGDEDEGSQAPVENPEQGSPPTDFGVPAEQGFGVLPKSSTGVSPLTSASPVPQVPDQISPPRPAEGARSLGNDQGRAKPGRQNAAGGRLPRSTSPEGQVPPNPERARKAPERHVAPRGMVEEVISGLTERMTGYQRDKTVKRARILLALEGITAEQLAYRAAANLRMIGGANAARSPYGFACSHLFRKQYGCSDPACEDGRLFGRPTLWCRGCAERRMDKAAAKIQRALDAAEAIPAQRNRLTDPLDQDAFFPGQRDTTGRKTVG